MEKRLKRVRKWKIAYIFAISQLSQTHVLLLAWSKEAKNFSSPSSVLLCIHFFFYPSTPNVQCTYLLSCVPPVLQHIPCIPPFLHSSFLASILSLILPLLHPSSFHASLLSIIPPLLHPSCPAFFLSCFLPCLASAFSSIPSFLNSSFPASLLSWIPYIRQPSTPASHMSCIPPILHSTVLHPAFVKDKGRRCCLGDTTDIFRLW